MSQLEFHPVQDTQTYAEILLPLAIPKLYTYYVPEEFLDDIQFGIRVEVQFGKSKLYTGLVVQVNKDSASQDNLKPILSIIDQDPIITPQQVQLWRWMSAYYCCTMGEIMMAALPANLKLSSETIITLNPAFNEDFTALDDKSYLIAEAVAIRNELTIDEVQKILGQKAVYTIIKRLLQADVIHIKEELKEKFQAKKVKILQLAPPYNNNPNQLQTAFDKTKKSEQQTSALMAIIQLSKQGKRIRRGDITKLVDVGPHVFKALEKKGIIEIVDKEISRLGNFEDDTVNTKPLSRQQEQAIQEIKTHFENKTVTLLHGVTGSGKTRVYVELIKEAISAGGQTLYLLPEIALTTQIINRLQKVFGDDISVYHSRMNNNQRVELWQAALEGKKVILGARSALFLPLPNLKLIVVDEAHDPSFKQQDPAPRYQARDAAIYYANLCQAKVLLGTATPSIESYYNAEQGKFGLVEMPMRFGGIQMPEVIIVDAKKEAKLRKMQIHFTAALLETMQSTLGQKEQIILFQNRRGFAPFYQCETCGWSAPCIHCDVSLTYHKFRNHLKCHYCGYQTSLPNSCPSCGHQILKVRGFGTEKIEDDLQIYFPENPIARMDLDTVRGKNAFAKLLNDFEENRIEILVGTQMVTKGLDFENVGLVGVLSADQLLQFPDFRSNERAFQLMTQVSGRAGRKHKRGKVLIQAYNAAHPVLTDVINHDFKSFYQREIQERKAFQYPPFFRMIQITLKHKKPERLNHAAEIYGKWLKTKLGNRVKGPAVPYVSRIRTYYLTTFLVKLEKHPEVIHKAKSIIQEGVVQLHKLEGFSSVRVNIDVDPN